MIQQFLSQIIIERLLRALLRFIPRACGPVTLIEAECYCLPLSRAFCILRGAGFRWIYERLVASHPNKWLCAARKLCESMELGKN